MAITLEEIKNRAITFSKDWDSTTREEADAKPFLDAFINVFGVSRRRIATFEYNVKKLGGNDGYIDMLWKGKLLVEMKSKGKDLSKALFQALDYTHGLKESELPKYILLCDFNTFILHNLETGGKDEFLLSELYLNIDLFGFISGYERQVIEIDQDPVNIIAAELMGNLHDELKKAGYFGHNLEVYLVRLLFCLFADDTSIFSKDVFHSYILNDTKEDGSDLASAINLIFQILNTPIQDRSLNLSDRQKEFPYVNGGLFEEPLLIASFNKEMRLHLLSACELDWSGISPAIFGSMFQSVMNPKERHDLGAHYTSELNILKLVKPLFLDKLWKEFESIKTNLKKLNQFHGKISKLTFLDPACGCGNFLIITYRELRLLELEVLKILKKNEQVLDLSELVLCDVDKFYGIEYEEFPAQIAQVALWLVDHQMNMLFSKTFGCYFLRLPLLKSPTILHGDALETDWNKLISRKKLSYIMGNPPFMGSRVMTAIQKKGIKNVIGNIKNIGDLDYVTAWYIKSAQYIQRTKIDVAFVSTNSIVQGLQSSILWSQMIGKYNVQISFAHRTFKWSNEAKGNAAVYCVIIGFTLNPTEDKKIYIYNDIKGEPHETLATNINGYLLNAKNIFIGTMPQPLCDVPSVCFGNMPADGGHFLFTDKEKNEFILKEPKAKKYIKPFISAKEYLNNEKRWCLWLKDAKWEEITSIKTILERINLVREVRNLSARPFLANTPHLFAQITVDDNSNYLLIPRTTSENRKYIPMSFFTEKSIPGDSCHVIPNATLYHFGILMSEMHMEWVKAVCGRLKSDFRYSKDIVYNNFPWPEAPTEKQIQLIEEKAQAVLDIRLEFPKSSLADLYSPLTMPPSLIKGHKELDKAVDSAYDKSRISVWNSDATKRLEYLFELYEKYQGSLFTKEKKRRVKK